MATTDPAFTGCDRFLDLLTRVSQLPFNLQNCVRLRLLINAIVVAKRDLTTE